MIREYKEFIINKENDKENMKIIRDTLEKNGVDGKIRLWYGLNSNVIGVEMENKKQYLIRFDNIFYG